MNKKVMICIGVGIIIVGIFYLSNVPQLCSNCARITERCHQCGKLKN